MHQTLRGFTQNLLTTAPYYAFLRTEGSRNDLMNTTRVFLVATGSSYYSLWKFTCIPLFVEISLHEEIERLIVLIDTGR